MRELHVVAVSDDGRHVVLEGADEDDMFLVALDDRLRALVGEPAAPEQAPKPAPTAPPAPRSTVTPKQIQARLGGKNG